MRASLTRFTGLAILGPIRARILWILCITIVALLASACGASRAPAAGTLIVLNKSDDTASLIDDSSGEVWATLPTGSAPHEVAVSPNGATAVATNYGTSKAPGSSLTVIDVAKARVERTIDLGNYTRPHGVQWLDAQHVAVTVEGSRALVVVHVERGEVTSAVETEQETSHMVALTPDGKRAFVANIRSDSVTAIDLAAAKKLRDIPTGDGAEGIDISPDGRWVWVTNRGSDTVVIIDAARLEIVDTIAIAAFPIRAHFTPNGRWVLVSNARSGDLAVIDAVTRKEARRISFAAKAADTGGRLFGDTFGDSPVPIGIEIRPDGKRAWVAHTNADAVAVLDLESWSVSSVLTAGKEPDGLAYSPVSVTARQRKKAR